MLELYCGGSKLYTACTLCPEPHGMTVAHAKKHYKELSEAASSTKASAAS